MYAHTKLAWDMPEDMYILHSCDDLPDTFNSDSADLSPKDHLVFWFVSLVLVSLGIPSAIKVVYNYLQIIGVAKEVVQGIITAIVLGFYSLMMLLCPRRDARNEEGIWV